MATLAGAAEGTDRDGGRSRDGDDARGRLDLAAADLGQHRREARLSVSLHDRLPPTRMLSRHPRRIDGAGRHLCLIVNGEEARHRMLCPGGRTRHGRVEVGVSRVFENGYTDPRGSFDAELERTSPRSLSLRFPLADAGLEPGQYSWRLISGWNGVSCADPPPGPGGPEGPGPGAPGLPPLPRRERGGDSGEAHERCFDRAPDHDGSSLRVRELVKVGCTPARDDVFTNGPRGRKRVALTFDDGPSEYTESIMRILDEHGAEGTFFLVGDQVAGRESLARKVLARGNEIANHSLHHEQYAGRSSMRATNDAIEAASGFTPCMYRPPYGLMDGQVATDARREGMSTALWDVDTNDWQRPGSAAIYQRATAVDSGSIVLMHDGGGPREQTVEALPRVIDELRSRGFRLVTVTELMGGRFRWREDR